MVAATTDQSVCTGTDFNFTVLAKDSISAGCSDYVGRTAAGGSVNLHDFKITKADPYIGCALESNSTVNWIRGTTIDLKGNTSCIAARKSVTEKVDASTWFSIRCALRQR